MEYSFEPTIIKVSLELTPKEAETIVTWMHNSNHILYTSDEVYKLYMLMNHIAKMDSETALKEMRIENARREGPTVYAEGPGQEAVSRP